MNSECRLKHIFLVFLCVFFCNMAWKYALNNFTRITNKIALLFKEGGGVGGREREFGTQNLKKLIQVIEKYLTKQIKIYLRGEVKYCC